MVRTGQWSPKPTTRAISNRVYEIWPELSTSSNMVPRIIESLNITQFNPNDHGLRIKILDKIMEKKIYHHQYATKHGNNGAGYISSTTCDKTIKFAAVAGPIKPPLKKEALIKSVSSTDPINIKASSTEIIKSVLETDPIKIPLIDTYDLVIDGWDINDNTIELTADNIGASSTGIIKSVLSTDLTNIGLVSTGISKAVLSTDSTNIGTSSAGIIKSALSTDLINIGVSSTAVDPIKHPLKADPIKCRIKDGVTTKSVSSTDLINMGSSLIEISKSELVAESIKPPIGDTHDLVIDRWDINGDTFAVSAGPMNYSIYYGESIYGESIKSTLSTDKINNGPSSTGIIRIIKSVLAGDTIKSVPTTDPISYRLNDYVLIKSVTSTDLITFGSSLLGIIKIIPIPSVHLKLLGVSSKIYCWSNKNGIILYPNLDSIPGPAIESTTDPPGIKNLKLIAQQKGIILMISSKLQCAKLAGIEGIDINSLSDMTLCRYYNSLALAHIPLQSYVGTIYFDIIKVHIYLFDEYQIGIIKRNIFKYDDEQIVGNKCIDIYSRTDMTLCSCNNLLALAYIPSLSIWSTIYFNDKISQFEIYFYYLFYTKIIQRIFKYVEL